MDYNLRLSIALELIDLANFIDAKIQARKSRWYFEYVNEKEQYEFSECMLDIMDLINKLNVDQEEMITLNLEDIERVAESMQFLKICFTKMELERCITLFKLSIKLNMKNIDEEFEATSRLENQLRFTDEMTFDNEPILRRRVLHIINCKKLIKELEKEMSLVTGK